MKIFAPISGEITRTDEQLEDDPGLMKADLYQQGWMCVIKPSNWKVDTDTHYLGEDASAWAARELDRFKDFLSVSVMKHLANPNQVALQDGGELVEQPLVELPEEVWDNFQ